jgi:pimeloyl-ACP methyl ester carboxylesterase
LSTSDTSGPDGGSVRSIRLRDGRDLRLREYGDPDGFPVLHHHGGLSSGLDAASAHPAAKACGVRLLSPDRPGIGGSDPLPGRTLRDWADDVEDLVDGLDLRRLGLSGWSLGGCFALASADRLGDRATGLALIASTIPVSWPGMLRELNTMDRWFTAMSRHGPGQLAERAAFAAMGALARSAPSLFARSAGFPSASGGLLSAAVGGGLRHPAAVIDEYRILDSPWGFDPAVITIPTRIWQGDDDDLVPVDWSRRLHDAIDGSILTVVPKGTHYLAADRWDEILGWLGDPATG